MSHRSPEDSPFRVSSDHCPPQRGSCFFLGGVGTWLRVHALLLTILAACGEGDRDAPIPLPDRPGLNVIVVTFDALRADVLGVYGSPLGASPEIDAWAELSMVFDAAYAVSPVTPTSFASLFTALSPLDVFRDWRLEAPGTLAQTFSAAGYATGAFLHNPHLVTQRASGLDSRPTS